MADRTCSKFSVIQLLKLNLTSCRGMKFGVPHTGSLSEDCQILLYGIRRHHSEADVNAPSLSEISRVMTNYTC